MRHWLTSAIVFLLVAGSNGCVSQKSADDLKSLNRKLEEQVIELKARLEEKDARIAGTKSTLEVVDATDSAGTIPYLIGDG